MSLIRTGYDVLKDTFSGSTEAHKRVILVGTRGSSKTTALGCLSLTCDIKSLSDPNFSAFIDEKTSGILQVPSDLCMGRFPEATPPGWLYEADMIMTKKGRFGKKTVVIPFCETAGEDMEALIGPHSQSIYQRHTTYHEARQLTEYICNSHGYILAVPVPRARIKNGQPVEHEPDVLLQDPDVNIRRILAAIFRYKRQSKSPDVEGIAVLLTKYDMANVYCKAKGMDLYQREGATRFLHTYFRQTTSLLKHYGMEKVQFFPVHVQTYKKELPDGDVEYTNQIMVNPEDNLPIYSRDSYLSLIDWILETFAK